MSIIPTDLQLQANQQQIEQNMPAILSAYLTDQNGNPIPGADTSLYIDHSDYGGPLFLSNQVTDMHGKALFEITLRNLGNSTLIAHATNLASSPVNIRVVPSSVPTQGPRTWNGVAHSLGRLGVDLNTIIDQEISKGNHPTKEDLCNRLGLDYDKANDRNRVSQAIYNLKTSFDYVWRVLYEQSPAYGKDFAHFMQDTAGYSKWKNEPGSPYSDLKSRYGLSETDIHQLWVTSSMWDNFIQTANQYNLHLFVSYFDRGSNSYHYKQPNFWEYVIKQIESASHWGKAMRTILTRHRDLGMMLTSGESTHRALEGAETVRKMITQQSAPKFRCPTCWQNGTSIEFSKTEEYFEHIKKTH